MTPAARLSAAIELIETIDAQRVPAAKALKEWGTAHRYAGSGDRAAISGLIWDVLRRRASSAWLMDADTPRARVLGMLRLERGMDDRGDLQSVPRRAICAGAAERGRALGADLALARRRAAAHRRRLSGMARCASGRRVRRRSRGGGHRDGEPRAARSARQHAEGQARKDVCRGCRISARSQRHGRRSACASNSAPTRAIPAFMPRRISSRAPSKCRTRARSSRRCCRRQSPASR